jgi:protein CLEC16A
MGFTDWLFGSDDWDGGVDSSSTNGNNKYNMQYLRSQLAILHSTPVLNTESRYRIMSALQEITELLIWDDQHYDNDNDGGDGGNGSHNLQRSKNNSKDSFVDVFMEQGLAAYVLDLLKTFARERRQDPSAAALMGRLLRMLNILIENLRHDTSMYYLLSNNFLNEVIIWGSVLREDVSGGECEEAVAYYVTLLKTVCHYCENVAHTTRFIHTVEFEVKSVDAQFLPGRIAEQLGASISTLLFYPTFHIPSK